MMKLALIGSYGGHVNLTLGSGAMSELSLAAVARWGKDDPLGYFEQFPDATKDVKVYDDYREMLKEVKPDVVGVFMPLYRMAEASLAAIQAGCHVVTEKPLATTLEDLSALRKAVDQSGKKLVGLFAMRTEPAFAAVHDLVRQGRIGEPVLACAQKSYPFAQRDDYYKKRQTYGGSIPWQAIHAIDFVSYCTGKDYARATGMNSNVAHPSHAEMEDNGAVLFEFAGGGHAVIWFDYLRPWGKAERKWGDDRLRIAGTEAIVEVVEEGTRVKLTTPDAIEDVPLPAKGDLFAEFLASIRGAGKGLVTTAESFRITEVALKTRQAADTGRIVDL